MKSYNMTRDMRESIQALFVMVIGVGLIILLFTVFGGERHIKEKEGEEGKVGWTHVNLREEPDTNTGEILMVLCEGTTFEFTGKVYDYVDGPYSYWFEIKLEDGTIGWIVSDAID